MALLPWKTISSALYAACSSTILNNNLRYCTRRRSPHVETLSGNNAAAASRRLVGRYLNASSAGALAITLVCCFGTILQPSEYNATLQLDRNWSELRVAVPE